jgi:hypothetical protein
MVVAVVVALANLLLDQAALALLPEIQEPLQLVELGGTGSPAAARASVARAAMVALLD